MSVGIFSASSSSLFSMVACRGLGPAVSPRNVRKTTVMPGNREDRGRQQLDQVSPLGIDSFFPLVSACVRLGDKSVSTVSVLQASLDKKLSDGGASSTLPALVASVAQRRRLKKDEQDGKDEAKFLRNTTGRGAPVAGCHRGCSEVYLGNSTAPSASFQELVTSSQSQLTYKTRKKVSHWRFFDPNLMRAKARPTEVFSSRIKLEYVPAVQQ